MAAKCPQCRCLFSNCRVSLIVIFILFFSSSISSTNYAILYQTPADCIANPTSSGFNQFFDISRLACAPCSQNSTFQKSSENGLGCACQLGYHLTKDFGGDITCAACPKGQIASYTGWECVSCVSNGTLGSSDVPICVTCDPQKRQIAVERDLDGSWVKSSQRVCATCANYTSPDASGRRCSDGTPLDERHGISRLCDGSSWRCITKCDTMSWFDLTRFCTTVGCVRCSQLLSIGINDRNCACPTGQQVGDYCFSSANDIVKQTQQLFKVTYGSQTFDAEYLKDKAQISAALCNTNYQNLSACSELANMCTLIMYGKGQSDSPNACTLFLQYATAGQNAAASKMIAPNLPDLYYSDKGSLVLTDKGIPIKYTFPNSTLDFITSSYSLDGKFTGYKDVRNGLLQLCKNSDNYMNAAYTFGTTFKQTCKVIVDDFWDTNQHSLEFYDLWLKFRKDDGSKSLYAIPILIDNYLDGNGNTVNTKSDKDSWQLVRRFFLVDNVGATQTTSSPGSQPRAVRYAKDMTIFIQLQPDQNDGLIYPPYLEINYDVIQSSDLGSQKTVDVSFSVVYSMDRTQQETNIWIAVGVLWSLGVLYAAVQTWGWSRRAGQLAINFISLTKFVMFLCGNFANALFAVILGSSIWSAIFFKQQTSIFTLVPDGTSPQFLGFLISAFLLKLIQVAHLLFCQITVDIYLIDWERPTTVKSANTAQQPAKEQSVSMWRTYFVANEWNEIQTTRLINPVVQYFLVVLFLNVFGFGNLATMDPNSEFQQSDPDKYYAPYSNVLRFAWIGIVYIIIACVQWFFITFVYERFFEDKIRQYVDLCSLCNVSVFILENDLFGYYIHGRSVHGKADVGLREMHENFIREEKDLCGKRGLLPDEDHQTFQIAIPRRLRSSINKVIQPILENQTGAMMKKQMIQNTNGNLISLDVHTDRCIEAYKTINRILQNFIDHSLGFCDYMPKRKTFIEGLMNVEFQDPLSDPQTPVQTGFFYYDGGHSFDAVLFYGHEITLVIFEILFFGVMDLATRNYFLDAALTFLLVEVIIKNLRDSFGRNNLAKKTMVDKRFLI